MGTLYSIFETLSFNVLNILGVITLGAVLFLGGKILFITAKRILKDMEDK